ncbi:hypothetical protein I5V28_00460 [Stenotrophomonas maltophilia]|nr:hypothetical protein [Stenotrophomonas maltophilia]
MARIRFVALLVVALFSTLAVPDVQAATDAGQATMMCRNSINFQASNSARQCVDQGRMSDGVCRVGLPATNGPGLLAYWDYDCNLTCKTRVDGQAGMINGTMYSGGVCDNGCKMQPNLDPGTDFSLRENGNPNAISIRSGTWRASGSTCIPDSTPPKPENKDEYCHQTGSYTVCKSKEKTCISTASGFRTCASDTSNKSGHTATNNPRTEAASISAPNTAVNPPANRPGEDWKPTGQGGSITNNNGNTTNNFNGYKNEGTPNGNTPTPGDGSGPGAGGSNGNGEKGEGNGNTATGGGTCTSPPATGGDPILGMIAMQTWATRCAAEKSNGGKVTGDVGNCDAPFSVEGDTVQANQLRAQRAQLCAGRPGEGQGSGGNPHAGAEDVDGPGKWSWKFDADLIDTSGFGGGSCPTFGTLDFGKFGSVSLDNTTWWCQLVSAIHTVMLLMGMFISFRIVFGDA